MTHLHKLKQRVNETLALDKALKMKVKNFIGWENAKENMPEGDKFSYEYRSPWDIEQEAKKSKSEEVRYGFVDRLRRFFGLQPRKH